MKHRALLPDAGEVVLDQLMVEGSRDRASLYAQVATAGASQAMQVADRWRLFTI
jgi:hypothetical protein